MYFALDRYRISNKIKLTMAPTLKIALIQFQAKPLSLEYNFIKAAAEIRVAAARGGQLVVLPEFHLTSWVPEHPDFAASCAQSMAYLRRYQALAQELNIHIVPGTIVEAVERVRPSVATPINNGEDMEPSSHMVTELRNMAYFIAASSGHILSTYQKKNLWHVERGVLSAGLHTPHKAFDVPLPGGSETVRVGMLICWDLAFPEAFRELVVDGAQLVVVPAYWHITKVDPRLLTLNPNSQVAFLDSVTVARAHENTCAVAFCNAWGQSQIAMPVLGSLGKLGVESEGIILDEVDFNVLDLAEEQFKVRADLLGKEWHYSPTVTIPPKGESHNYEKPRDA
ncbi:carbon-nitrogen hydrolase [Xylaria telfairii]|nr:carbon-nitrogen hydrolase [Xylaria telfairii]